MNKRYGISLITLVITIVVIIILTAAVVLALSGENGLIAQAKRARLEQLIDNDTTSLQMEFNTLLTQKAEDVTHIINTDEYKGTIEGHGYNTYIENDEYFVLMDKDRLYSYKVIGGIKLELNYLGPTTAEKKVSVKVNLEATGGEVSTNQVTQTVGENYKNLPTASKDGCKFLGWSLESENKEKIVNSSTKVSIENEHTLYAIWENKYLDFGIESEFINYGSYGFEVKDGVLASTNSGIALSKSDSCYTVDLSQYDAEDEFIIELEASVESESTYDYGYAILDTASGESNPSDTIGRFMKISGWVEKSKYSSDTVSGGKCYYLHIGYKKDGGGDLGEDRLVIHDIKVIKKYDLGVGINNVVSYDDDKFKIEDGNLVSSNNGKSNSYNRGYVKIDLSKYSLEQEFKVKVKASISSEKKYDIGFACITESTDMVEYNGEEDRFMNISGSENSSEYSTTINGGGIYYLHIGYHKDDSKDEGDDKLVIHSIKVLWY